MANNKNKFNLLQGFSGKIGKDFVIKQYKGQTVISKFPDMSNVKASNLQKKYQSKFAQAVQFAQNINNTPSLKIQWKQITPEGKTVYNFALSWYMLNN